VKISDDCSRIYTLPNNVYSLSAGSYSSVSGASSLTWLAFDSSLTYGIISSKIYKYSPSGYVSVYSNLNTNFGSATVIRSHSNRIILYTIGNNNILIEIYVDNNNALTQISSTTLNFTVTPTVSLSS